MRAVHTVKEIREALEAVREPDKAIAHLQRAFAQHSGDMIFINVEPSFDPIRGDSRFQEIVRRVGLPPRA